MRCPLHGEVGWVAAATCFMTVPGPPQMVMTAIGMAPAGPPMPMKCGRPLSSSPDEARAAAEHLAQRTAAIAKTQRNELQEQRRAQAALDACSNPGAATVHLTGNLADGRLARQVLDPSACWQRFVNASVIPASHHLVRVKLDVFNRGLGVVRLVVRSVDDMGVQLFDVSDPEVTAQDERVDIHLFKKMASAFSKSSWANNEYVRVFLTSDSGRAFGLPGGIGDYFTDPFSQRRLNVRFRASDQELYYAVPVGQKLRPSKRGDYYSSDEQWKQRKRGEVVRDGLGIPVDQVKRVVELFDMAASDLRMMKLFGLQRAARVR